MPRELHAYRALSSMLVVATMLPACERIGLARQCHVLAETVNVAMRELGEGKPQPLEEARLRQASTVYQNLAQQLGPMEFSKKELALEVASLNRLLLQASEKTRGLADAVAEDERADASLIKRELGTLGTQMKLQGNKINMACRSH